MSPAPGNGPTGVAAYAPIIVAVCAIVISRKVIETVFTDLNTWLAFVIALVVGYLAYVGVERLSNRRNDRSNGPPGQS
ncbi:hypothetical protein SAMN04489867_2573 [Pedococcus dokdonensis]|uniref:Uncharacterized protein n=1 Tax=Pedococcus dokdonensis TaxID=443156 RepID=A0A1H0T078_9MICO|nr:hypothetical protein [Pedococcus dokdonensis]SDP47191.1 hypothetical protein SAMN04489867_2573 [Pedococcus dokdonensis]